MAIELQGIPVCSLRNHELVEEILRGDRFRSVFSLNAEIVVAVSGMDDLNRVFRENEFNTADGYWVARFTGWKYGIELEKNSGSDLIYDLSEYCTKYGKRLFLLGSSTLIAREATERLRKRYDGLTVDFCSPPVFEGHEMPRDDNEQVLRELRKFQPDVVFVCFGNPKQEIWVEQNRQALEGMGVAAAVVGGGALDFVAGKIRRAPRWMRDHGFEWLYRLIREPYRFRRQLLKLPVFLYRGLREIGRYRWSSKRQPKLDADLSQ